MSFGHLLIFQLEAFSGFLEHVILRIYFEISAQLAPSSAPDSSQTHYPSSWISAWTKVLH